MSRVILDKYPDGSSHVVVGWDHPALGAFWQEWATKKEVAEAEKWLEEHVDQYQVDAETTNQMMQVADAGVKREDGMWPGIPLDQLLESMPDELRPLLTEEAMTLLKRHSKDSASGNYVVDLTK